LAVVIAQHMPERFTTAFASRLDRSSPFEVREAQDGDEIRPGRVLISPGEASIEVLKEGGRLLAKLNREPQRYVPSIDLMMTTAAGSVGSRCLAVVLTGMGSDGREGVQAVRDAGGYVMAESEESAVIFGMPGEAIATGVVDEVTGLDNLPSRILTRVDALLEVASEGIAPPGTK
jgi:two-component system chemotaxis response regulator CheB